MNEPTLKLARLAALCLFVAATAAWAYQMHAAGCTADLKGGTWGNPALALEIEAQAMAYGLVASGMLGAVLALSAAPSAVASRSLRFLAGAVLCFGALLAAGFFIETESAALCASARSRSGPP